MTKNDPGFCSLIAMVCLSILLAGCGHKSRDAAVSISPEPVPPAKASAQLETVFQPAASVPVRQEATVASVALKNDQLDVAYAALQKLKYSNTLTPEQDMAVRNAIIGLSEKIARGVSAGDPRAIEMAKRMQRPQSQ